MAKVSSIPQTEYEYSSIKKAEPKRKQGKKRSFRKAISSFLTVLMSAAVVFMLIKGIFIRIELTKQNDINVRLEQKLSSLEEENRRLSIRYESQIDLAELEEYAKNELGMQKPSITQIKKIDTETQDKAVLLGVAEKVGLADKIGDLISIISDALL